MKIIPTWPRASLTRFYLHGSTIIKVLSHMKYIDIKLVCPITYGKSKTNLV